MKTTTVFRSGNSQAVRIPKEFHLDAKQVEIFQRGDEIVIRPKRKNLARVVEILASFPADFMEEGRQDDPPRERDLWP